MGDFDEKFEKALAATGRKQDYLPRGRYGMAGMKRYAAMAEASKHPDVVYVDNMRGKMSPSKIAEVLNSLVAHKGLEAKFFFGHSKRSVKATMNRGSLLKPTWVSLTAAEAREELAKIGIAF